MIETITPGAISSLVLEGIKILYRKIIKDPLYEFPAVFYILMLPLINAVAPFVLTALGLPSLDPILSMTLPEITRYLGTIFVGSLISIVVNDNITNKLQTQKLPLDK